MAVGGLPSKRQGRLGRPKDHRHPRVMVFFIFSSSHSSSPPSSFLPSSSTPSPSPLSPPPPPLHPPLSFSLAFSFIFSLAFSLSFSFASSLAFSLAFSFSSSSFPACSLSYSYSFPIPLPLVCLHNLVRPPLSQAPRSHPTGPGSIPAYPYRPSHTGLSPLWPRHRPQPVFFKTNPRQHLSGWDRGDGFRLPLRNHP